MGNIFVVVDHIKHRRSTVVATRTIKNDRKFHTGLVDSRWLFELGGDEADYSSSEAAAMRRRSQLF